MMSILNARSRWIGVVTLAAAVMSSTLHARQIGPEGGVIGTVSDSASAVVPDAVVMIAGASMIGGARTATTDARGRYRFAALPPGTYDIEVARTGFRTVRRMGVRLAAGATLAVDVMLEVAGIAAVLEVRNPSPLVDVKSPAAPTRLEQELMFNLPTHRSIAGIINLVPGVAADVAFGGSQKSNEILLDGVRLTEPVFQDPLLRVNYNWVQEVQVVSDAYGGEPGCGAAFSGSAWMATSWAEWPTDVTDCQLTGTTLGISCPGPF